MWRVGESAGWTRAMRVRAMAQHDLSLAAAAQEQCMYTYAPLGLIGLNLCLVETSTEKARPSRFAGDHLLHKDFTPC